MKSEEFIREVDEELKRDRALLLWRRYGGLVVGFALVVLLATGGWVAWERWQLSQRTAEAARFATAEQQLAGGDAKAAADAFAAVAADGDTGYATLARLREAKARLDAKDEPGAVTALDGIAGATSDPILHDLGALLAAMRTVDKADPAALTRQLEPLAAAGNPWRHQARELLAVLAIRTGDTEKAKGLLEELSKELGVPATQQRRAEELLQALGAAPKASS